MASFLLGDLNDYIQPSVECIKPPPPPTTDNKPVEINLNDCLACSGCVTSAETVLVAAQTDQQILEALRNNQTLRADKRKIFVYTVCASTRVAMARRWMVSPLQAYKRIEQFLKERLGASLVVDASFGNLIALKAAADEFIQLQRNYSNNNSLSREYPLLSSECPGWICYAEKKQAKLLPYISKVRSPQQIIGSLVKSSYLLSTLPEQDAFSRSNVFHVSVMSCYDKKLEASREEFSDVGEGEGEREGVRDVDCVITTTELLNLMENHSNAFTPTADIHHITTSLFNNTWVDPLTGEEKFISFWGGSGGGYLYYILRQAAKTLFNLDLPLDGVSPYLKIFPYRSNIDYVEYLLYDNSSHEGTPLLSFASISGFRNIQTFVQKAKLRRVTYDYVEIMACPGACLFGGGQPTTDPSVNKTQFRQEMEQFFYNDCQLVEDVHNESDMHKIYHWMREQGILYTSYRALESVKKSSNTLAVQW